MSLLLVSLSILWFILFFYGIGLWYIAFVPLLFLGLFFWYYWATQTIKLKWSEILQKYSLYVARTIILAWLVGVLNYIGINLTDITLWLLALNLFLRIWSYIVKYQDGKIIFQLWYYLSIILLLGIVLGLWWRKLCFSVFSLLRVSNLGVIAFMVFIVGLYSDIEKYFRYLLGIFSLGTIFLFMGNQIHNVYGALLVSGVLLSSVYYGIYRILQHRPISNDKKKDISVRRILAGERVTMQKKYFNSPYIELLYMYIDTMPNRAKQMLELLNIIVVVVLIVYYITHIGDFTTVNHIFYWLILWIFIINVWLLKKVKYNSIIQNLVVFFVINFAIYVSLFSYFNGNMSSVASRWIFRNICSASMIFYAHKVPMLAKIFDKIDYIYWIIASVIAMLINVILLMKTQLPGELIFFFALVYLGLQSMIIYYATKYVGKLV